MPRSLGEEDQDKILAAIWTGREAYRTVPLLVSTLKGEDVHLRALTVAGMGSGGGPDRACADVRAGCLGRPEIGIELGSG